MNKATKKQINYCETICDTLDVDRPNYDSCQDTFYFLKKYVPIYKEIISYDATQETVKKYENNLTKEALNFLEFEDNKPGVYVFWCENCPLYVGKTTVKNSHRVASSYSERKGQHLITHINYIELKNIADVNILEVILITELKPLYNKDCNCNDFPDVYRVNINFDEFRKISWEV